MVEHLPSMCKALGSSLCSQKYAYMWTDVHTHISYTHVLYVYTCAYMHVCIYKCMYVYMYIYKHILCTYTYIHVYVCMYVCMHIFMERHGQVKGFYNLAVFL